ncbi:hypothetical protein FH972_023574 [Carpinus fangiana]|uniref:Uncharacterized protein n=1 Tax=Carpinus fangiana TaxID=176857 RepID=A0A5N6KVT9_9ROSI|nr:hypothetical protein FH972_023574 [Carpinus fangiana]
MENTCYRTTCGHGLNYDAKKPWRLQNRGYLSHPLPQHRRHPVVWRLQHFNQTENNGVAVQRVAPTSMTLSLGDRAGRPPKTPTASTPASPPSQRQSAATSMPQQPPSPSSRAPTGQPSKKTTKPFLDLPSLQLQHQPPSPPHPLCPVPHPPLALNLHINLPDPIRRKPTAVARSPQPRANPT